MTDQDDDAAPTRRWSGLSTSSSRQLADLRRRDVTVFELVSLADTSDDYEVVEAGTDRVLVERLSADDIAAFYAAHPDWSTSSSGPSRCRPASRRAGNRDAGCSVVRTMT